MKVRFVRINENAVQPRYSTDSAAGADICALPGTDTVIQPGETVMIHTGIAMETPDGYAALVYARSGMASRRGLAPANKVGVIDPDYRGEVMVALHNHSSEAQIVKGGERIAQIVITPFVRAEFTESDSLSDTARGKGGFGSTGTF